MLFVENKIDCNFLYEEDVKMKCGLYIIINTICLILLILFLLVAVIIKYRKKN